MSDQIQTSSIPIRKERIRLEGQKALAWLNEDSDGSKADAVLSDFEKQTFSRGRVTKFIHEGEPGLSRFEKDLAVEYVMHEISSAHNADAWLDALPLLAVDIVDKPKKISKTQLFFTKVFGSLAKYIIVPNMYGLNEWTESCERATITFRENRQTMKILGAGMLLFPMSVDSLAYEYLKGTGQPNIQPPLIFIAVSALFVLVGIGCLRRDFPNKNFLPLICRLMTITALVCGLLVFLKIPPQAYLVFFVIAAMGNMISLSKEMMAKR